jgi:arylsulfatase A-like enzyme
VYQWDPQDPISVHLSGSFGQGETQGGAKAQAARPLEEIDILLAQKGVEFIQRSKDGPPFFLMMSFVAPHLPLARSARFVGTSQAGRYGDFVQQLDHCVGMILSALDESGLKGRSIVIFTSDNGAIANGDGNLNGHLTNGTLLGQKTDTWEGGHRIPLIATWPGHFPAGKTTSELISLTDLMASLAAAVGTPYSRELAPDSINQLPLFLDPETASTQRREMVLRGSRGLALRFDQWVFIPQPGSQGVLKGRKLGYLNTDIDQDGQPKPDAQPVQLYNLKLDRNQMLNLHATFPAVSELLRRRLSEITGGAEADPAE